MAVPAVVVLVGVAVVLVGAVGQRGCWGGPLAPALELGDGEPFAPDVGLQPEVGEEHEEEHAVHPNQVDPQGHLVVALLHEVVLADVHRHHDELGLPETTKYILILQIAF